MELLMNFIRDEQGQDMIEYTLLLAFIALACVTLGPLMVAEITRIWTTIPAAWAAAT